MGLLRWYPREMMREVHGIVCEEYREMAKSRDFAHAGNVGAALVLERSGQHCFRYLPQDYTPDREWPLLVFLHGAAGNLVLYSWLWARFADRYGYVVLSPTWDNGEWWRAEGIDVALAALDETLDGCRIDKRRVFVCGYSNGGVGGWSVIAARPEAFRGYVMIAGATGPRWKDRSIANVPVLIVHGERDRVMPTATARRVQTELTAAGREAGYVELGGEDHAILFRSSERIGAILHEWIERQTAEDP